MNKSNINGMKGETFAARYLVKKGYNIVAMNYRIRYGEIDIIAEDEEYIIFVEVKAREENAWYLPREAVNKRKQQKLVQTASMYLSAAKPVKQPRFDVIEVYLNSKNQRTAKINHIKNAF